MSITHFSGPIGLGADSVEVVTAAKTLTSKDDNGKTFIFNNPTGVTVTLPPIKSGVRFKFMTGAAFATSPFIVVADAADVNAMSGTVLAGGAPVGISGADQITFVATTESIGDFVELISDGVTWLVFGNGSLVGSITAA